MPWVISLQELSVTGYRRQRLPLQPSQLAVVVHGVPALVARTLQLAQLLPQEPKPGLARHLVVILNPNLALAPGARMVFLVVAIHPALILVVLVATIIILAVGEHVILPS